MAVGNSDTYATSYHSVGTLATKQKKPTSNEAFSLHYRELNAWLDWFVLLNALLMSKYKGISGIGIVEPDAS